MMRKLILISVLSITGCAKHYVVCIQGSRGAGCSHQQFTAPQAKAVGRLMATLPIAENVTVWVEKKGASKSAPTQAQPATSTPDNKL